FAALVPPTFSFALPPKHEFEAGAVRIRVRHPALLEFEVRQETFHQLLLHDAERRAVGIPNHVVDGKELAAWFEPALDGAHIIVAARWIDGAEERVFENPIEAHSWFQFQKIAATKLHFERRAFGIAIQSVA